MTIHFRIFRPKYLIWYAFHSDLIKIAEVRNQNVSGHLFFVTPFTMAVHSGVHRGGARAACTPLFEKRGVRRTPLFFAPLLFFRTPPGTILTSPGENCGIKTMFLMKFWRVLVTIFYCPIWGGCEKGGVRSSFAGGAKKNFRALRARSSFAPPFSNSCVRPC